MKTAKIVLALAASLIVAGSLWAADEAKPDEKKTDEAKPAAKQPESPLAALFKGLDLSDEQKAQAEELNKEFSAKFKEVVAKMEGVLTDEQKKAREEAGKAAMIAKKSHREFAEAVSAAMKLTDEQKTKLQEIGKEMAPMQREFMGKLLALLTPEQQEQLKQRFQPPKAPPKAD